MEELNPIVVTHELLESFAIPLEQTPMANRIARAFAQVIAEEVDRKMTDLFNQEK